MVNKAVVLETIKKMYDSGIEDSVVKQTLLDVGLNEREIEAYMAEAKGQPIEEKPAAAAPAPTARPSPPIKQMASSRVEEELAAQEAMHATTQAAIADHGERLEELGRKVGRVEQKLGKIHSLTEAPSNKELVDMLAAANQRLGSLEKQVSDLKALNKALKTVMEKILETDRKILGKM